MVESCVDKKFTDRLSSFERCWSSLLRLLMALRRSLLRIDKASLLEICSLKIRNFRYTPSCLQLLRKLMSNFNRNKQLQHLSKELGLSINFLSTQLSAIDFYILTKSITSYNTQQKKLSSLTRDCNLLIFTANETITNLTQYELSQEESDLLKDGLYFSIQPDKNRKAEIFTTFEKIHSSFLSNLKSEETKSQIKAHFSYLANSYTANLPHVYYVKIASYEAIERIKTLL